jgi:hypothetical protein
MFRTIRAFGAVLLIMAGTAQAAHWYLGEPSINTNGTRPSLWHGTYAYLDVNGGDVYHYDGDATTLVYDELLNFEVVCAGSVVAWRRNIGPASTNDIMRWDGTFPVVPQNVSNSPNVNDRDLAIGENGDLLWSARADGEASLMHYDATTGQTASLGVRAMYPALYVRPCGALTYAYQVPQYQDDPPNPDAFRIMYFDGSTTHDLGEGSLSGAFCSLWDGAVAWIADGEGDPLQAGEVFFWKNGQTTRVTDDDQTENGVADAFPSLWNDLLVWSRNGPWEPRVWLWDGTDTVQLTEVDSSFPSLHYRQLVWESEGGLRLADLRRIDEPDCNGNAVRDHDDLAAGTSPDCNGNFIPDECDLAAGTTFDCNDNAISDVCDIVAGSAVDCNCNDAPDDCDIAAGTSTDLDLNGVPDDCEDCNHNGIPDGSDIYEGTSSDCTSNGIPDECDIRAGTSTDCNGNTVPDECDLAWGTSVDCNENGWPDQCDIAGATSSDCNLNRIPDDCDIAAGTSDDCNANAVLDQCDIASGSSLDFNLNGIPDECDLDCTEDGVVDGDDHALMVFCFTGPYAGQLEAECRCSDFDTDDDVDLTDFAALQRTLENRELARSRRRTLGALGVGSVPAGPPGTAPVPR